MKTISKLLMGLAAIALIASCAKDGSGSDEGQEGVANLTVKIKTGSLTRGIVDGLLVDQVVAQYEDNIEEFVAVIFDRATGAYIQSEPVTNVNASTGEAQFYDVPIAGAKRIVIIANGAGLANVPAYASSGNYSDLATATTTLDEQTTDDYTTLLTDINTGFLMTGEWNGTATGLATPTGTETFLLAKGDNNFTIQVERVVVKVELGQITFNSDEITLRELANFNITDIGIQKAISESFVNTGAIDNSTLSPAPTFYGAFSAGGSESVVPSTGDPEGLLGILGIPLNSFDLSGLLFGVIEDLTGTVGSPLEAILTVLGLGQVTSLADFLTNGVITPFLNLSLNTVGLVSNQLLLDVGAVWYVLPNDDPNNPTTLTLKGTYNGTTYYYPIPINIENGDDTTDPDTADNTDGTFVQRNMHYVINVRFNSFMGSPNPDTPIDMANVDIDVVVKPWGVITQDAVW